jgi:hypothetical protein
MPGPPWIVLAAHGRVDDAADDPRQDDDEGVQHALDQRQRHHVAVGDVADLVADHGLDLVLVHVLQQAGADRHQGVVAVPAGGEGVRRRRVEDADLRHADAALLGLPRTISNSHCSNGVCGCSMICTPMERFAIHLEMNSEIIEPPKPNSRAMISSPLPWLGLTPRMLRTINSTAMIAKLVATIKQDSQHLERTPNG